MRSASKTVSIHLPSPTFKKSSCLLSDGTVLLFLCDFCASRFCWRNHKRDQYYKKTLPFQLRMFVLKCKEKSAACSTVSADRILAFIFIPTDKFLIFKGKGSSFQFRCL